MKVNPGLYQAAGKLNFLVLVLLMPAIISCHRGAGRNDNNDEMVQIQNATFDSGAITRGDSTIKTISLVFTGDMYAEGGAHIIEILEKHNIRGSFFFTGNFYRNPQFRELVKKLYREGHYLGPHSDRHLLYCDWENREKLLITEYEFKKDIADNLDEMAKFGIKKEEAPVFLPPYEWYNKTISRWSEDNGLILINYTPGTLSHADYTTPGMASYKDSRTILESIYNFNSSNLSGLNGFILLSHIGAGPERKDKFYLHLDGLISELQKDGYSFCRIDSLPGLRSLLHY